MVRSSIMSVNIKMEILKGETVRMKHPDKVEKLLSKLKDDGASKLQVIADFDKTLTRVHKDGVTCATTYAILEEAPCVTEDYRLQTSCLFHHYHPIEVDPNLTKEQKIPHMIEWYNKGASLMPMSGVCKEHIPEMVKASNVCLREGCEILFKSLDQHNVPLMIFSAGIGDILNEVLKQQDLLLPNMKVTANFMKFDEQNKLQGFKNSIIYTFTKKQSSIENVDYFNALKPRKNIILLGDSLGDLDMSEGAVNPEAILRIGFLNHKIEECMSDYLDAYDIVLTDDQTMDVVNGLLQQILC